MGENLGKETDFGIGYVSLLSTSYIVLWIVQRCGYIKAALGTVFLDRFVHKGFAEARFALGTPEKFAM